jgi:hypothetical protein
MSIYNTTDKCRSFSGEIDTDNMPILKAEEVLNCEDLPFEVVRRELNKDIRFCSLRVLSEAMNILNQD